MKRRQNCFVSAAIAVAAVSIALISFEDARAQIVDPSALDHLKCYRISDTAQPTKYVADLRNQFGLEPGCVIGVPARLLCVETEKTVLSTPPPPGGGPAGDAAGHFLCYMTRCPNLTPVTTIVEDQFGRRPIVIERARLLCAPANKLICGDGEIDPGEQCDPGSAATNVCPGGVPCRADCTCPGEPCACGTVCTDMAGNVGQCIPADPTSSDCECKSPPTPCPCGVTCITADGQAGQCQASQPGSNLCECRALPDCPCGDQCRDPESEELGRCEPVSSTSDVCECKVPPPPECPCGTPCETDGDIGRCEPSATSNVCECRVPPDCPCNTKCEKDGAIGLCRPLPGLPAGECDCFIPPPPADCPCGKECVTASGEAGKCKGSPSNDGVCRCEPKKSSDCPCGKECTTDNGVGGKCRPLAGLPPGVCGCAAR